MEQEILNVPFDTEGNQMFGLGEIRGYRKDYKFYATLTFLGFSISYNIAFNAIFISDSNTKYTMFPKDMEEIIPYLKNGSVTGNFTFVQRGQNFGVKLLKADF